MSNIGTMTIDFAASVARLEADVKRGADATEAGVKRMSEAAGFARSVFDALAVSLSVGAVVAYMKSTIDAADALNDMRQQLGFTARDLSAYRLIAEQSGTTIDGLAGGMKKLSVFLTEHGDKLKAAGITATDTNGAFLQLADLFAAMPDGAQKTALAIEVFGKAGADLIPTLNQGGAALREQLDAGQRLNPVIDELAGNADQFNDSMARMRAVVSGSSGVMLNELLKTMNAVIREMDDATVSADGFSKSLGTGMSETLKTIVVLGGNVGFVFQGIGREIGGIAAQLAALGRGDFAAFTAIGEAMKADAAAARADIDAWSERIMNGTPEGAGGSSRAASEARARAADAAARSARALMGGGDKAGRAPREEKVGRYTADEAVFQFQMAEDAARWEQIKAEDDARIEQERTRRLASLAQKSADIAQGFLTEQEQEQMFFASRMETLQAMQEASNAARADDAEAQLQSDMYYHDLMEQEKLRHLAKMGDDEAKSAIARRQFEQMTNQQKLADAVGFASMHLAYAANLNKGMFQLAKVAAIAEITISGIKGAEKTWNTYPYPLNIPMTAAHVLGTVGRLAAAKSATFGGGGSVVSTPGGSVGSIQSAPPIFAAPEPARQAQASAPTREIAINVVGEFFDLKTMTEKFLPKLEEAIGNGAGNLKFVIQQG